jgi:hypothetical protein
LFEKSREDGHQLSHPFEEEDKRKERKRERERERERNETIHHHLRPSAGVVVYKKAAASH